MSRRTITSSQVREVLALLSSSHRQLSSASKAAKVSRFSMNRYVIFNKESKVWELRAGVSIDPLICKTQKKPNATPRQIQEALGLLVRGESLNRVSIAVNMTERAIKYHLCYKKERETWQLRRSSAKKMRGELCITQEDIEWMRRAQEIARQRRIRHEAFIARFGV
jgi:hypothetical protein